MSDICCQHAMLMIYMFYVDMFVDHPNLMIDLNHPDESARCTMHKTRQDRETDSSSMDSDGQRDRCFPQKCEWRVDRCFPLFYDHNGYIYTYISRFWMNNIFWICLSVFHAFNLFDASEDSKNYCEVLFANRTECNIYQKILRYSSTTRPSQGRKFQSGEYPVRAMKRKIHLRSMPWKALCLLRNPAFQEMTEDTPWNAEKKTQFHGLRIHAHLSGGTEEIKFDGPSETQTSKTSSMDVYGP